MKFDELTCMAQVGVSMWPHAFGFAAWEGGGARPSWELFLSGSIHPLHVGPLDLGLFLLLAGRDFLDGVATRAELGPSLQWAIDRSWALRYQLGFATETNLENTGLVSALAVDLSFL